jgi:DMSO/TMAO reductase YedYZ molybdopterin-dependent catalytic subunit
MKKYYITFLTVIALIISSVILKAQSVKITGEVTTPFDVKLADMPQLPQTNVVRKDKDGNDHTYSGVILSTLLQKAGVTLDKDLKGENLTKYVLVEASDGYMVAFALAELDKDFTDRNIILASMMDGKPLPKGDGPFRIIVQDEKRPARCIKQVTGIKVGFAKR